MEHFEFEDCWYDFYKERLEEIAPNILDVILLEGDRVEEGEWDTTYERWCPASYQRVLLVVNTNGKFHGFEEGAFGDEDASGVDAGMLTDYFKADTETSIGRKIAHNYPATFQEDGMPKMPYIAGHLDISTCTSISIRRAACKRTCLVLVQPICGHKRPHQTRGT